MGWSVPKPKASPPFQKDVVGKGKDKEANRVLKIQEKRLGVNLWRIGGINRKGSHVPVVFFTRNPCRRSPDANERRRLKELYRQWSAWAAWDAGMLVTRIR